MTDLSGGAVALVRAEAVHKSFGRNHVLKGVDLNAFPGEVVAIIGPSGSGKSTLLRCINHLETIDSGRLLFEGDYVGYTQRGDTLHELPAVEVAKRRARIGMVFQQWNLFMHRTVLENVIEAPMRVSGLARDVATKQGMELLESVGLANKAQQYPARLSGGQQQRVAIARALAMRPKLMLFDEATSALDPELVGEVLKVIKSLALSGMTMILVTHEISFAREIADTVFFMDEGLVVEHGPAAQVLDSPRHERTRSFLERVNRTHV